MPTPPCLSGIPPSQASGRKLAQATASVLAVTTLACGLSIILSFGLRLRDTFAVATPSPTAVVFTGQFDRIDKGLSLLEQGHIDRLFISGVNPGAGLTPETFVRQFRLSSALEEDLTQGVITLATGAQDTIENALETSCWLAKLPGTDRIVLITSHRHMPRASLLLEQATSLHVERLSSGAAQVGVSAFLSPEFRRFVATWFMTFLPARMWPARSGFTCAPS